MQLTLKKSIYIFFIIVFLSILFFFIKFPNPSFQAGTNLTLESKNIEYGLNYERVKNPDNSYSIKVYQDPIYMDKLVNVSEDGNRIIIDYQGKKTYISLGIKGTDKIKKDISEFNKASKDWDVTRKYVYNESKYDFSFIIKNNKGAKITNFKSFTYDVEGDVEKISGSKIYLKNGLIIDFKDLVQNNFNVSKESEKSMEVTPNFDISSLSEIDLDPVITTNYSTADSRVEDGAPTTNYGSATTLQLDNVHKVLVKFDLSVIPANSTVQQANISLRYSAGTSGKVKTAYPITKAWVEAQVTWNARITGTNWTTLGLGTSDYNTTYPSTNTGSTGYQKYDVTTIVNMTTNGLWTDNGWVVTVADATSHTIYSKEQTGVTYDPYWEATYTLPPDIIVNTPVNNNSTANFYMTLNTTAQTGTNNTVWYSTSNGKHNYTLCTNSNNCQGTMYFPKAGTYNLTVWANTSTNLVVSETVTNISIGGASADTLTIFTPVNNTIISNSLTTTLTTSQNDTGSVWYSFNNGITNTTFCTGEEVCNGSIIAPKQGTYNISVWANVSSGAVISDIAGTIKFFNSSCYNETSAGMKDKHGSVSAGWTNGAYLSLGENGIASWRNNILIYFNVSNLVGLGYTAQDSWLNYTTNAGGSVAVTIPVHKITSAWNETDTSSPTVSAQYFNYSLATADSTKNIQNSRLTDMIQEWLNGSAIEYGIYFNGTLAGNSPNYVRYESSESATVASRPRLCVLYISANTAPTVTNIAPANASTESPTSRNFTFNITDDDVYVTNASVYLDGVLNTTVTNSLTNVNVTISVSGISSGAHYWYIKVYDSNGVSAQSASWNFTVGTLSASYLVNISDSMTITDSNGRKSANTKSSTQSVTATDNTNRIGLLIKRLSDSFTEGDLLSKVYGIIKTISDSFTMNDIISRLAILKRISSQQITYSESTQRIWYSTDTISQSITSDNIISRVLTLPRNIQDSFSFQELLYKILGLDRHINEAVSESDIVNINKALIKTQSDSFTFSDMIARILLGDRDVSDTISYGYYEVPQDGLLAWWKLDNNSTTQIDSTGGYNGNVLGTTYFIDNGKINGAYDFLGYNDSISYINTSAITILTADATNQSGTFTGWFYFREQTQTSCCSIAIMATGANGFIHSNNNEIYPSFYLFNGNFAFVGGGDLRAPQTGAPKNSWIMATTIINKTMYNSTHAIYNISIYNNYTLIGSSAKTGLYNRAYSVKNLGGLWGVNTFNGSMDEIKIYNRTLSDSELLQIYNAKFNDKTEILTRTQLLQRVPSDTLIFSDLLSRLLSANRNPLQNFIMSILNTNPYSGDRDQSQSLVLSDNIYRSLSASRAMIDNFVLSEQKMIKSAMFRSSSDSMSFTDLMNRLALIKRMPSDSMSLSDSLSKLFAGIKNPSEQITYNELQTDIYGAIRNSNQSITESDYLYLLKNLQRNMNDQLSMNDILSRMGLFFKKPIDSMSFSDSVIRTYLASRNSSQPITESDYVNIMQLLQRTSGNQISMNDLITRVEYILRNPTDSANYYDSVNRMFLASRGFSENIPFYETMTPLKFLTFQVYQDINLNDVSNRIIFFIRNPIDSFLFGMISERTWIVGLNTYNIDSLQSLIIQELLNRGASMNRGSTEAIGFTDTASLLKYLIKGIQQDLTLQDAIIRLQALIKNPFDTIVYGDSQIRSPLFLQIIAQNFQMNDMPTSLQALFRGSNNILQFNILSSRTELATRSLIESFQASESITRLSNDIRYLTDSFSITGVNSRLTLIFKYPTDNFNTYVLTDRIVLASRNINDLFNINEVILRSFKSIRTFGDSIQISESFYRIIYVIRNFPEGISTTEYINEPSGILRYLVTTSQSLNIDVIQDRFTAGFRTVTDLLHISHTSGSKQTLLKSFIDYFTVSDSSVRQRGILRTVADSFNINENLDRMTSIFRNIYDVIVFIVNIFTGGTGTTTTTTTGENDQIKHLNITEISNNETLPAKTIEEINKQKTDELMIKGSIIGIAILLFLMIALITDYLRRSKKIGVGAQVFIVLFTLGITLAGVWACFNFMIDSKEATCQTLIFGVGALILLIVVFATDVLRRNRSIGAFVQVLTVLLSGVIVTVLGVIVNNIYFRRDGDFILLIVIGISALFIIIFGIIIDTLRRNKKV